MPKFTKNQRQAVAPLPVAAVSDSHPYNLVKQTPDGATYSTSTNYAGTVAASPTYSSGVVPAGRLMS